MSGPDTGFDAARMVGSVLREVAEVVSTIVYTGLGLALFIVSWLIIELLTPFSLRKEIEEDQNLALAVLIGAIFIALAILISSVIRS